MHEQIERNRVEDARPAGGRTSAAAPPPFPREREREGSAPVPPKTCPPERLTSLLPTEPVQAPSPRPYALSGGALVQGIKKELKCLGCYTGRIDDDWASGETKSSVKRFVKYANLSNEPKNPEIEFLNCVRSRPGRVCPLECRTQKIERSGQCVARDKEPAKARRSSQPRRGLGLRPLREPTGIGGRSVSDVHGPHFKVLPTAPTGRG